MILLDNTLRDGSYLFNFQFSKEDTQMIVERLEGVGFTHIEVGHGLGLGAYRYPNMPSLENDEDYIKTAVHSSKRAKIGVFCIPGIATLDDLECSKEWGLDFVRIGVEVDEADKAEIFLKKANELGLYTTLNYLKSYIATPKEFANLAQKADEMGADNCYIVDSAGHMTPKMVGEYFDAVREKTDIPLSFHGHDNLGLATANALKAYECGASMIDVTLQGIGRSAGNTATEKFISVLESQNANHSFDLLGIMDLCEEIIRPKLDNSGTDTDAIIYGLAGFHSSNIGVIKEIASQHNVDHRKLILAVCAETKKEAPFRLVNEKALQLVSSTLEN